ncbi:MAG TPA: ParA family protein [Methylocystis sp.]|jgi:chromosome partitioning protein
MHIVAFVTQKGGAGKSTLASNVAVASHIAGERVFICDLDPLQALVKWSRARKALDIPVEHIPTGKLTPALAALESKGVTLAIIDTPAADLSHFEEAVRAADLCVIPARPNALDLWASEMTLAKIRSFGKNYAFLLNQCPPAQQGVRVERGAKALQELGALLAPLVSTRVDYQDAIRLGLGVGELNPNGAAAREMRKLWASLRNRLENAVKPSTPKGKSSHRPDASYPSFFDQALIARNLYVDLLSAFLPANRLAPPDYPGAPPEDAASRRRSSP